MAKLRIGLIIPPRDPVLPLDTRLHPDIEFVVEGLGIDEMTVRGFEAALERIAAAAAALKRHEVASIAMLGTSLSFFRGPAFNASLEATMGEAAGCPAVSATTAVVDALNSLGARRLAVGAAYEDEMNARLKRYFEQAGFEIVALAAMNIRKVREAMAVPDAAIAELAERACGQACAADALFLSCGAFATGHLLGPVGARCGMPVVSTTPAALAAAIRRAAATRA